MRTLLILLALLLSGCIGSSGLLGDDDDAADDDDAVGDDDDTTDDDDGTDDDDAVDDDDATPPKTLEEGFVMWDPETYGGGNGQSPAGAYALLPRGSVTTCDTFLAQEGYDSDDDFVGIYFIAGATAGWEGDYADFYSADCRPNQPTAHCFTAWGTSTGNDFWESDEDDTLVITTWADVIYGVLTVGGEEIGFALNDCGKTYFGEDYDGATRRTDDEDPAGNAARSSGGGSSWRLRFR